MKRFISSALVISFAIIQPLHASEILPTLQQSDNPTQFMQELICPSGTFNLEAARRFLAQLKTEVKVNYGVELDLTAVIEEAIRNMHQSEQFSETEISTAREFFSQLIETDRIEERTSNFLKFNKHKSKKNKKKGQELVLPDKMASGYVSMFGGALLCLLPFGFTQTLGTGLILGGLGLVIAGSAEGERPYYIDTETGGISPIVPKSDPSFGVGTQF